MRIAKPITEMYVIEDRGYISPCWIWQGKPDKDGYGYRGKLRASRYVYGLYRGRIPNGLQLDHLCKVRICVNPWHLDMVTCAVNNQRTIRTKITAEIATKIRERYAGGDVSQKHLAQVYGISRPHVAGIINGTKWSDK